MSFASISPHILALLLCCEISRTCSLVDRMIACGAIDPGSNPGRFVEK